MTAKRSNKGRAGPGGDRLSALVGRFRILRGWRVRWDNSGTLYGQAAVFPGTRQAWIFPWGEESAEPPDFLLHEVLHCALGALMSIDGRKRRELKQAEEFLIQDICSVFLDPLRGAGRKNVTSNGAVRPCLRCGSVARHGIDSDGLHEMRCVCGNHVALHQTEARAVEVWNWSNAGRQP